MMKFSMRPSRVLKKLRSGEVAKITKINLSDVRAIEIAARYGFDCLWIGMEHIGTDWSVIEKQVLAAKAYDVDILCRVARGSYSDYIRPLELDSTGIMVPHVMNAEDAASVVRMTRFPPVGKRAVDGGNADGGFCNVPFLEYLKTANEQRFVILQIEDPEAVEDLDRIAAVEGYDILLFGPGDFSVAIGAPGQVDHPDILRARRLVAETARKYGKFAGTVCSPAKMQEYVDMGYTFLSAGADVVGLSQYYQGIAQGLGIETSNEPVSQYGMKS
jgi:4-hydroxy-2-oxoheptanedioate aldolase